MVIYVIEVEETECLNFQITVLIEGIHVIFTKNFDENFEHPIVSIKLYKNITS